MTTFMLLGRYTQKALKSASPERTRKAYKIVEDFGGKIKSVFSMLGDIDLLIHTEFPGLEAAMRASVALTKLTGIGFSTYPALPVDRFDKILSGS